jgi:hypothetical protein
MAEAVGFPSMWPSTASERPARAPWTAVERRCAAVTTFGIPAAKRAPAIEFVWHMQPLRPMATNQGRGATNASCRSGSQTLPAASVLATPM